MCDRESPRGDFAPDNKFYFTIRREVPAKALIIESASRGRSDSFYLQSALGLNDALPFSFTLKTAGAVDPSGVSENALVILNDSGSLSPALGDSMTQVCRGGRAAHHCGRAANRSGQFQSIAAPHRAGNAARSRANQTGRERGNHRRQIRSPDF